MIFKNDQADIGPITTKLTKVSPGVYTIRGGYISQPGEWNLCTLSNVCILTNFAFHSLSLPHVSIKFINTFFVFELCQILTLG